MARNLAHLLAEATTRDGITLRQGKVTAVAASPSTVTVTVGGYPVPGVRHLSTYTPVVDDVVWLLQDGPTHIVLGVLAA